MTNLEDNHLVRTFAELRAAGKKTLLPFITAGYPDLQTTEALLHEFRRIGVRICELGIPYSDPIADGAVIQSSYTDALAAGVTSEQIFDMVRRYRNVSTSRDGSTELAEVRKGAEATREAMALLAMVSYSIVFRHGVERYTRDARDAGFDGMIIPDLPLEEDSAVESLAAASGLANVLLVAPTTPARRRVLIARRSRGFIYFISVAGVTGERTELPAETIAAVAELRRHTDTPICVGFGVSSPETVKAVCRVADGAIVGSAIVRRIAQAQAKGLPRERIVKEAGRFIGELLAPLL